MTITELKAVLSRYNFKAGYTVSIQSNNRGDAQLTIVRGATLFLKAWSFEKGFNADLARALNIAAELKDDFELAEVDRVSRAERLRAQALHYMAKDFDGLELFDRAEIQKEINLVKAELAANRLASPLIDAKLKVTTGSGATFTAPLKDIRIEGGALRCDSWLMRLELIENKAYATTIVPEIIRKCEFI